jgi:hypothetical protein
MLGAFTEPVDPANPKGGVRVFYVYPTSAAVEMDLRAGDVIVAINDVLVPDQTTFTNELRKEKPGSTVRMIVQRLTERVHLKGKLKSRQRTLSDMDAALNQRLRGHPLPSLPSLRWWDPASKQWVEKSDGMDACKGKVTVLFSFDDCDNCTPKRYRYVSNIAAQTLKAYPDAKIAFVGLYHSDAQLEEGLDAYLKKVQAMIEKHAPVSPIAVAVERLSKPASATEFENRLFLANHGTVILDPEGNVQQVRILGYPEDKEFLTALQAQILKHVVPNLKKDEKETKPGDAPPAGGAAKAAGEDKGGEKSR